MVRDFLHALATGRVEYAVGLVSSDITWHNTGLPALRGQRALDAIRYLDGKRIGFDVTIHSVAGTGEVVLTDRIDYLRVGPVESGFRVFGSFTVHDGRITKWDDHFSARNMITGLRLRKRTR